MTDDAAPREDNDSRFTNGLMFDVFEVLDRHGYVAGGDRALARAWVQLLHLTRAYEGTE